MEYGRAREIMSVVRYCLYIKLLMAGESGSIPLVKDFLNLKLYITGETCLMPLVEYFPHHMLQIIGELGACYWYRK